jgi:hypothetical protein
LGSKFFESKNKNLSGIFGNWNLEVKVEDLAKKDFK